MADLVYRDAGSPCPRCGVYTISGDLDRPHTQMDCIIYLRAERDWLREQLSDSRLAVAAEKQRNGRLRQVLRYLIGHYRQNAQVNGLPAPFWDRIPEVRQGLEALLGNETGA